MSPAHGEPDESIHRRGIGGSQYISRRGFLASPASDILISGTVRDLVVGSSTGFEDRGSVELRGAPAPCSCWRSSATARPQDRPRRNWRQCHPRASHCDGPVGPRAGGEREADTVDPARDGAPRPGHQSQPSSYGSQCARRANVSNFEALAFSSVVKAGTASSSSCARCSQAGARWRYCGTCQRC
jgi:hypothetical protein